MENKKNIILTSQEYFDVIRFDEQEAKDKVAYLLYFVTEVAQLRKDMTPKILADRIADQYKMYCKRVPLKQGDVVKQITADEITNIVKNNPDYFAKSSGIVDYSDRKKGDVAYRLSKAKSSELNNEFDKNIRSKLQAFDRKANFEKSWWLILVAIISLLFLCMLISSKGNEKDIRFYSLPEYLEAVSFSQSNDLNKCVFFTYYITNLTKLRDDITAEVINERLVSLNFKSPAVSDIKKLLDSSSYVKPSTKREDAYTMTKSGTDYVEQTVRNFEQSKEITISWIIEHTSAKLILSFFGIIFTVLTTAFSLGYKACKFLNNNG